ncbi:hypothetical protein OIDMADRAFT_60544 [Oidiodendron maius Zn]|uniref:Zn(2)-C6 fungal-type domain-containing protein n=1 Tax=Oidiodendron maius (strain Zn) TaxID=913774 RepID=A0A0C3GF74_OIDMZ|nr:hypothetical protein OIDMADRAFT_60544 [Oidiodendron maius Zn]
MAFQVNRTSTSMRSARKSKAGCKACKLRKVKCDELRPVCGNCKTYYSNRIKKCDFSVSLVAAPITSATHCALPLSQQHILRCNEAISHIEGLKALYPFDARLESKLPNADHLLHHYLSALIVKWLPAGYKPETNPFALSWWSLVQTDNLLFRTILLVSALDLESHSEKPNIFHSERYTIESMQLLRARVQDPVHGTSNQTIGAVATLASLAYTRGNMREARTHIEGLQKMVAARGGMGNIRSSSPVTASVTFWFSLLLTLEPQFPPEEPIHINYPPQWILDIDILGSSQVSELLDFKEYGIRKPISDILLEIRYLSHFFTTHSNDTLSPDLEDLDIHSTIGSIIQRLLQTEPDTDPRSRFDCVTECCRFAAAIFLLFLFENHYPDPTRLINSLIQKLQKDLGSAVHSTLNGNRLLGWLFSVGGVAALNLPVERDWFVSHLTELAAELGLLSWDKAKNCLQQVVWVDAMNDQPFRQLWNEVLINITCVTTKEPFCAVRYWPIM